MRTVIRGGTVVDGTGAPGVRADVAVEGGHIVEVGSALRGDETLEADGCVVAPGFIDIHTHYDAQVFWDPALTPSIYHGVTSVVAGNCGFSIAPTRAADRELIAQTLEKVEDMDPASLAAGIPWEFETFPEYLATVERHGSVLNYAAYIGHTALRMFAMGSAASDRVATDDEIGTMAGLVAEAMAAGAAGFATSFAVTHRGADGRPIPSRVADRREITALFKEVAKSGRGVVGVNGGTNLSLTECYELQPEIGAPFSYTAVLTSPTGAHMKAMEIHRAGIAKGAQVYPQVTCRPLSFSMTMVEPFTLNTSPVFAELMPRSLADRRAAYADPAWRQRVRTGWANKEGLMPNWDTFEIMESGANPDLIGKKLLPLAQAAGADPLDFLLDLTVAESNMKDIRVRAILANGDPDGIAILLKEPGCVLGLSDAGAHVGQLCDAPLPTDLLGNWVRGREVLTMEEAIRKLTSEPARLYGFDGRGQIRVGAHADIVVFDPSTVAPGPLRRVRDFPANAERLTADQPVGMHHLMVNGTVVRRNGTTVEGSFEARPGHLLKPSLR